MNNVGSLLEEFTKQLTEQHISTARLDSLILLEDVTSKDRSWLLAHQEHQLETAKVKKIKALVERRARHEPLAYIRGKSAFYGREFLVTAETLQPRPETETMIELLLQMTNDKRQTTNIIDVGTGSGCIAITAKLELPDAKVYATDISEACLKVAQKNAKQLHANIKYYKGNLLEPLPASIYQLPTTILANLPYVPESFTINQAAMFEPEIAIFGGTDGLDYYRQLFSQARAIEAKPLAIFTESLPTQHKALEKIAINHNYKLEKTQDFIQVFNLQ